LGVISTRPPLRYSFLLLESDTFAPREQSPLITDEEEKGSVFVSTSVTLVNKAKVIIYYTIGNEKKKTSKE
jgi:hypothetical protein